MQTKQRSQQLSEELNRLYGKLGSIISEMNQEKPHCKEINSVRISLDIPADRKGHYSIKIRQNQVESRHCQSCRCQKSQEVEEELKVEEIYEDQLKKQEEKHEVEEQDYTITVNDTSKQIQPMTAPESVQRAQGRATQEQCIQTQPFREHQIRRESIDIQTDEIQKPKALQRVEKEDYKPFFQSSKNKDSLYQQSSDLINKAEAQKKPQQLILKQKCQSLNERVQKKLNQINKLCKSKHPRPDQKHCNCQGILQKRSKRSLTPLLNNYQYKYSHNSDRSHFYSSYKERSLTLDKNRKKTQQSESRLQRFIREVKFQYTYRRHEKEMEGLDFSVQNHGILKSSQKRSPSASKSSHSNKKAKKPQLQIKNQMIFY